MQKNQANVKEIVRNVLSLETSESSELTTEVISQISENYVKTGKVVLPDSILDAMEKYEDDLTPPGLSGLEYALWQEFERYSPTAKKSQEESSSIMVSIPGLGLEFETYLDKHGTQRFKTDTAITALFDRGLVDLNAIVIEFQNGRISTEDLLNFYAKSGYSVGALVSLSHFSHLTFENPLW